MGLREKKYEDSMEYSLCGLLMYRLPASLKAAYSQKWKDGDEGVIRKLHRMNIYVDADAVQISS